MKLTIDSSAGALYLRLDDSQIIDSERYRRASCWTIMNAEKWWGWKCCTLPGGFREGIGILRVFSQLRP